MGLVLSVSSHETGIPRVQGPLLISVSRLWMVRACLWNAEPTHAHTFKGERVSVGVGGGSVCNRDVLEEVAFELSL